MADVRKRMEVEATYRDLVTPGAEKSAKAVENVGKRSAKAADQAAGRWDKFNTKFLSLNDASAKVAGVAGSAFASMGASVSLATANVDSLGSSIAGAAGSVAAGFAAGGPVGGALALLSAGIGAAIFAFKQMKEEAREAAKVAAEEYAAAAAGIRDLATAAKELREEQEFALRIAQRRARGEDVDLERLNLKRERYKRVNEAIRQHNAIVEKARNLQAQVAELDSDDDDERAVKAREELARATDDLAASEQRVVDIRRSFDVAQETLELDRNTEARRKRRAEIEAEIEAGRKAAQARRDMRDALDAEIRSRERVVWWGAEGAKQAEEDLRVAELRTQGYYDQADALEAVLAAERKAAAERKKAAEDEKRAQEAKRISQTISGLDFRARRASSGGDPLQDLMLRHAEELSRFEGTRAEKAALTRAQYAEQAALAEKIAKAANDEKKARAEAAAKYVDGMREVLSRLEAERDGTLELFDLRKRMAEAAKEGGAEAVRLAKEQVETERQISAEKAKQAAEKQKEANFESNLQRLMSGGTMDKGLARRRNERRARNRMRKYQRAGQMDAEGNYRSRGIRGEDGRRLGLIHAGGTGEGLGGFSEWAGGAGDMDYDPERERAKAKAKKEAAEAAASGGVSQGDVDQAAADALKELGTTTGDGNETAGRILEAAKAAVKATEDRNKVEGEIADALEEANAKDAEAAAARERVHASAENTRTAAEQTAATLETLAGTTEQVATAVGKIADAVDRNTANVKRLLDAARLAPG